MLAHFAHIETYYAWLAEHQPLRSKYYVEALRYEYRRLSDCPAFVAIMLKNLKGSGVT